VLPRGNAFSGARFGYLGPPRDQKGWDRRLSASSRCTDLPGELSADDLSSKFPSNLVGLRQVCHAPNPHERYYLTAWGPVSDCCAAAACLANLPVRALRTVGMGGARFSTLVLWEIMGRRTWVPAAA